MCRRNSGVQQPTRAARPNVVPRRPSIGRMLLGRGRSKVTLAFAAQGPRTRPRKITRIIIPLLLTMTMKMTQLKPVSDFKSGIIFPFSTRNLRMLLYKQSVVAVVCIWNWNIGNWMKYTDHASEVLLAFHFCKNLQFRSEILQYPSKKSLEISYLVHNRVRVQLHLHTQVPETRWPRNSSH